MKKPKKYLKHINNVDVVMEIVYALHIGDGFKMKVNWYNITNEDKPPMFIEKDHVFIKQTDMKNWKDYEHGTKAKEIKKAA